MLLRLQLRLSSPLWLGPAYLPARPSLVCVRENAILFDHASSYQSSSFAKRGEIFLADSELRVLDGYSMVCADCGAIEAQFVRLAASSDFQCKTSLVVLDLDSPATRSIFKRCKRKQGWSLTSLKPVCMPRTCSTPVPVPVPCVPSSSCVLSPNDPLNVSKMKFQTKHFLSELSLHPVETFASTHCWWVASAKLTDLTVLQSMFQVVDYACCSRAWTLKLVTLCCLQSLPPPRLALQSRLLQSITLLDF